MSGAESESTNFVTNGNVRQNAESFPNTDLFNNVGAIKGYPGPDTGVAAAAGNPGPKIVMKGGRSPSPGPNYQGFKDGSDWPTRGYAPVKTCNNNQCGGRRSRRGKRSMRRGTRSMRRGTRSMRRGKRSMRRGRRSMRRGNRSMRRGRRTLRRKTRRHMRGGSPATVPSGSNSSGYHQYMSNQPFSNSYSAGGHLDPSENALANPVLIHPTNNCTDMK